LSEKYPITSPQYSIIYEIMDFCADLGIPTELKITNIGYVLKFPNGADVACSDFISSGVPGIVEFAGTGYDAIDYAKVDSERAIEIIMELQDELKSHEKPETLR
jgi:hypothetical protein